MTEKLKNPFKINELVTAVNSLVDDKQDVLVSGTNIKTINGSSILGNGNLTVTADTNDCVHKTGDESISGTKTFNTRSLIVEPLDSDNLGMIKVDNVYSHPNSTLTIYAEHKGSQQLYPNLNLWADGTVDISTMTGSIELNTEIDKEVHAHAPNTTTSTSSTEVATCGWVNEKQYQQITNCITEIPQDIKLELSSGTLTLKAGSKVYVPNGSGVFDVVTIASDLTITQTWGTKEQLAIAVSANGTALTRTGLNRLTSGTIAPTETNYRWWYDTTSNKIKEYSGGSWTNNTMSFPIAVVSVPGDNTATITSIDQVFNGFGYIGSTEFVLPGVKGLIPNGRNADGSLKNTEFSITAVKTATYTTDGNYYIRVNNNYINFFTTSTYYDEKQNFIIYNNNNMSQMIAGNLTISSGKITSFNPKTAFHAVDYNDFSNLKNTVDTVDSNVVHKTGNENIGGNKTFTLDIIRKFGTAVDGANHYNTPLVFKDSNGTSTGFLRNVYYSNNAIAMGLQTVRTINGVTKYANMEVGIKEDGTFYTNAPTPAVSDNSTQIATTAFVKAQGYAVDSGLVHTTGNESISGAKTFNNTTIYGADTYYKKSGTAADLTKQATTTENWFGPRYIDANNIQGGVYQYIRTSSGDAECNMQVKSISTNSFSKLALIQKPDGTSYATLSSTPATSDNSTKIATTAYVNNKHVVVSTLPASPDANIFYYIPE